MKAGESLFQVLMIKADGGGDDGVGGGEHPAENGDEMHAIEDDAIADGQTLVLTDIGKTCCPRELMPLAAIVEHGKTIIVAFHKSADNGRDPPDQGNKRQDKDRD